MVVFWGELLLSWNFVLFDIDLVNEFCLWIFFKWIEVSCCLDKFFSFCCWMFVSLLFLGVDSFWLGIGIWDCVVFFFVVMLFNFVFFCGEMNKDECILFVCCFSVWILLSFVLWDLGGFSCVGELRLILLLLLKVCWLVNGWLLICICGLFDIWRLLVVKFWLMFYVKFFWGDVVVLCCFMGDFRFFLIVGEVKGEFLMFGIRGGIVIFLFLKLSWFFDGWFLVWGFDLFGLWWLLCVILVSLCLVLVVFIWLLNCDC